MVVAMVGRATEELRAPAAEIGAEGEATAMAEAERATEANWALVVVVVVVVHREA